MPRVLHLTLLCFTFQKQKLLLVIVLSMLLHRDSGTNFQEASGKHQLFMFLSQCWKLTFFQIVKLFLLLYLLFLFVFVILYIYVSLLCAVFIVERFYKCLLLILLYHVYVFVEIYSWKLAYINLKINETSYGQILKIS